MAQELIPAGQPAAAAIHGSVVVPAAIAAAGDHAARRFLEFFAATIRNKNTRMAYYRAAARSSPGSNSTASASSPISSRCTSPPMSRRCRTTAAKPTVKQHLAAIRMLFDWLVVGQVLAVNPAHAVRGPKHVVSAARRRC